MKQLLVLGETILAQGPFSGTDEASEAIESSDAIYPKHVIDGWQIVDADLPDGFTCAGYTWSSAGVVAKAPVVVPPSVPQEISMGQAKEALLLRGKLATVNAAIAAMPGPEGDLARLQWEYRTVVRRDWPMVEGVRQVLQWTHEQVDELFVFAATL
jgi:hypothetical protein